MEDSGQTAGLVIKQTDYGEGNRILTVFTEEYGIIQAVSYGARRVKSRAGAASQYLCWGDFSLSMGGDIARVRDVKTRDSFLPIQEDIVKLSCAAYLTDITYAALDMNNPDKRLLHTLLNILYAMAYKEADTGKAKPVYELRLMMLAGFMPCMDRCMICGKTDNIAAFSPKGGIVCGGCRRRGDIPVSADEYAALSYILTCPDKRILSFNASDKVMRTIESISEKYVSEHLDREFRSLNYYRAMKNTGESYGKT